MAKVSRELPQGHNGRRHLTKSKARAAAKVPVESNGKLHLPSQENEPPERLEDSIIFIHGEKAIGKTSLAAEFEDALVMMAERGRRNLRIHQVMPKSWEEVKGYTELFLGSKFQTLAMDTIDRIYLMCFEHVCQENGISDPDESQSPYIIWDKIAEEFSGLIFLIKESGKGLVLISHSKARPLTIKRKGLKRDEVEDAVMNYERMDPTCKPAAFRAVQEMADFVFYYGYRDGKRVLVVRSPHNIYWTACGLEERFLDPEGTPIESFAVGTSSKEAYASLQKAYANKLYDIDYVAPRKPVAEKKRLTLGRRK